jgi:hypothetical protein
MERSTRALWLAAAALLLVACGLFWPLLLGQRHLVPFHVLVGDPALDGLDASADRPDWRFFDLSPVSKFYAEKHLAAAELRGGTLPLWNPYSALGVPLLADGQSQPFAPFFLPFMAWPNPWIYSLCLVVQLLIGGFGMALFLRRLGCGRTAVAGGALLFAFNPYTLNYLTYSDVWAYCWFPCVFLAAEATAARAASWWTLPVALALMGMSGHVEAAFLGAGSAYAYLLLRGRPSGGAESPEIRRWSGRLAVPAVAVLLSAWWIAPFLEWVSNSTSARFGHNIPYPYHPSACFLAGSELLWIPGLVLLAAFGLLAKAFLRPALALLPGVLWGIAMMFPWPLWIQRLATGDFLSGRYGRSILWFALTVWVALGLETLRRGEEGVWKRAAAALAAAAWWGAGLALHAPSPEKAASAHWVPLQGSHVPLMSALSLASLLCLFLLFAPSRWVSRKVAAACAAVVLVASALAGHPVLSVCWNRSEPRLSKVAAEGVKAAGMGRVWFPEAGLWKSLPPNLSACFGARDVRFSDPLVPGRLGNLEPDRHPNKDFMQARRPEEDEFLGVAAVFDLQPGSPAFLRVLAPESRPARAFWVSRAFLAPDAVSALASARREDAWRHTVFLERLGRPDPEKTAIPKDSMVPAALVAESFDLSEWSIAAPREGWLVVRDLYWPGWKAAVDGRSARVFPADGLFRAVRVPKGEHRVTFRYRPAALLLGAILSVLGLTITLLAVWRQRQERHPDVRWRALIREDGASQ